VRSIQPNLTKQRTLFALPSDQTLRRKRLQQTSLSFGLAVGNNLGALDE
jgi:hypothetical protein